MDFGGTFVNLSTTSSIKDLATIKVIPFVPDTDIILEFIDSFSSDLSELDSSSFSAHTDSGDSHTQQQVLWENLNRALTKGVQHPTLLL